MNEETKKLLDEIQDKINASISEFKKGVLSHDDLQKALEPLNAQLKDIQEKYNYEGLKTGIEELSKQIELLKQQKDAFVDKNAGLKEALTKAIKERAEMLKNSNEKPQVLKTVGTMTVGGSITGLVIPPDFDTEISDFNKRGFTIRSISNVGSTTSNVVYWTYKAAKEGSAGMTGEGLDKTQLDWTYVQDSANVKKVTSYIKISKEMLDDVAGIMSDINGELAYEINLLEETQLIEGTGLTVYLNGIEKYAQPLDNASLAGTIPNGEATKWDVIGAAIKQIMIESLGRASANAILMNPADVFAMVHGSRATSDEYLAPLAVVEPNGTRIYGLPVIETLAITAGEFLVGDFTKFHIKDREGLTIAMGYEEDDWTKNLVTILAEKRLVSYVKKNDEVCFVTDTFADGIAFVEADS